MRLHIDHVDGGRGLALGLTAVTLAVPVLLGTLFHVRPEALVPLSLALPFATMGVLDAVLNRGGCAARS
jgi:hypothetical protein